LIPDRKREIVSAVWFDNAGNEIEDLQNLEVSQISFLK
jgi:hypothetical protein